MTKGKKSALAAIAVAVLLIVGGFFWLTWSGSTKDIESVANQFKADSSWKLVSSSVTPPRTLCIGQSCPNLSRKWLASKTVTESDLKKVLLSSGWSNVKIENQNCMEGSQFCTADGKVNQYTVQIYTDSNDSGYKKPSVALYLR